jgi:uncharacterized membrane protein
VSLSAVTPVHSKSAETLKLRVPGTVVAAGCALAAALTSFSLLRHRTYLSGTFDMAFYVQDVWAIANGVWANTVSGFHVFADHLSPILIILSPLAYLPTAESLLVVQGIAAATGVLPAYRLGQRLGGHRQGVLVALWYGASAAIWHSVMFDFHPVTLGVPLLIWLIADVEEGKKTSRLVVIALLLALIREDMAVLAGVVLLQAAVLRRSRLLVGLAAAFAAIGMGYIVWVSSWPGGMGGYHLWTRFGEASSQTISQIVFGALTNLVRPDSLVSIAALLSPLLVFLPLRGWRYAWPGLAIIMVNCISSYPQQASLYYQYFAPAVPFLLWGASHGLSKRWAAANDRARLARIATWTLFGLLGPIVYLGFGLPDRFFTTSVASLDRTQLSQLLTAVPDSGSVSATDHLLPHLAKREEAFPFPGPMVCSQSLIFHVSQTFFPDYVALEWDAFGPDVDLEGLVSSWGYESISTNEMGGVWALGGASPAATTCPSVEEERQQFSSEHLRRP